MKKILFIWAVLFCFGTTAYGDPVVTSISGNLLSDGVHQYTGTITATALDGTMSVYAGKTLKAEVEGNKVRYTLVKVPLTIVSVTIQIPNITVDPATGDIPQQNTIGVEVLNVALTGNVYGNTLTDQTCDLVFDAEASKGFLRFEFTGTAVN